jgi:hypothetical protein
MTTGFIQMKHQSSRKKLGSGRPQAVPNLVETKPALGYSIDEFKVQKAYDCLAHVPSQTMSTNFLLTKSRDLKFYMSNDRVRNILHDNELLST